MKPFKTLVLSCTVTTILFLISACGKSDIVKSPIVATRPTAPAPVTSTWTSVPGEAVADSLTWIYPWGSAVEIANFSEKLPAVDSFKVYIKRASNPEWIEVPLVMPVSDTGSKYDYFVETRPDGAGMYNFGSLYVFYYGRDTGDYPSVKIVY